MTKLEFFLFAMALGAILGGIFVAWVSWTYLHQKIETLDLSLHARLSDFEHSLLAKVHLVRPQAPTVVVGNTRPEILSPAAGTGTPAPQPPAATSSAAPAPAPDTGDTSHSG